MTYQQIYEKLQEKTDARFTLLELLNIFKNEHDWVGVPEQLIKLKELIHNITGVRPGNCSGCNINVLTDMCRWLTRYEQEQVAEVEKPKRKRI